MAFPDLSKVYKKVKVKGQSIYINTKALKAQLERMK